jgi:hypothetical protein
MLLPTWRCAEAAGVAGAAAALGSGSRCSRWARLCWNACRSHWLPSCRSACCGCDSISSSAGKSLPSPNSASKFRPPAGTAGAEGATALAAAAHGESDAAAAHSMPARRGAQGRCSGRSSDGTVRRAAGCAHAAKGTGERLPTAAERTVNARGAGSSPYASSANSPSAMAAMMNFIMGRLCLCVNIIVSTGGVSSLSSTRFDCAQ